MSYSPDKMIERATLTSSKTVTGMLLQGAADRRLADKVAKLLGVPVEHVLAQLQHVLDDSEGWRRSVGRVQEQLTQYRKTLAERNPWEEVHTVSKHGERRCWFCQATKTNGVWDDPPEKGHDEGCLWLEATAEIFL